MTKPPSIVNFDRFYLGSIAVWLIGLAVNWTHSMAMLADNPAFASNPEMLSMMPAITGVTTVIALGITVLLWFLVSRKAVEIAKWIIVVLFGLATIGLPFTLLAYQISGPVATAFSVVTYLLTLAAVVMLFRADAKAWFRGEADPMAPDTFD